MPYIPQDARPEFDRLIQPLAQLLRSRNAQAGEVNYIVTQLLWSVFDREPHYALGSRLRAGVSDALVEFDRRKMAPYEDSKIAKNGDIVPLPLT